MTATSLSVYSTTVTAFPSGMDRISFRLSDDIDDATGVFESDGAYARTECVKGHWPCVLAVAGILTDIVLITVSTATATNVEIATTYNSDEQTHDINVIDTETGEIITSCLYDISEE